MCVAWNSNCTPRSCPLRSPKRQLPEESIAELRDPSAPWDSPQTHFEFVRNTPLSKTHFFFFFECNKEEEISIDSILKSRDITLPTKVHLVKAMVFLVAMYECESWTIKKAECWRIDAFELCCWRRLLRVPWTARRSNQSILKEISPEYSLEGLMLKLK